MKSIISFMIMAMVIALFMTVVPVNGQGPQMIERANVAPMYIANQTIDVQVEGLYAISNVPQAGSLSYTLSVLNENGTIVETGNITEPNGLEFFYYFNGLPPGMYTFSAVFYINGISSQPIELNFLTSPPPIPYTAYIANGNGTFYFHSDEYNLTGAYNVSDPFTVVVAYQYPGGGAQTIGIYNTTNFTFTPENLGQTVVINVRDKWGWQNSNHIDLQALEFTGTPYSYTFANSPPEPFGSSWWTNVLVIVFVIIIAAVMLLMVNSRLPQGKRRR